LPVFELLKNIKFKIRQIFTIAKINAANETTKQVKE